MKVRNAASPEDSESCHDAGADQRMHFDRQHQRNDGDRQFQQHRVMLSAAPPCRVTAVNRRQAPCGVLRSASGLTS